MSIVVISSYIVAFLLAASRLAPFTKPYWAWLPKVAQNILPAIVGAIPVAINAFSNVKTGLDFTQAILIAGAFAAPGLSSPHNHPELPPPAGTMSAGKSPSFPPLAAAMLSLLSVFAIFAGIALCVSLSGCAAALPAAKAADQAAVLLCDAFFADKNPTLSLHDVEAAFCSAAEDVAPFLAEAKAAEARAGAELEAKKAGAQ